MGAELRNNAISSLFKAALCLAVAISATAQRHPECIKYEVHERLNVEPSQVQALSRNCMDNNGFLENFASEPFARAGPVTFNTTFECCVSKPCQSDLECPFNFLCDLSDKRCKVANCELTDEVELINNEGQDCLIDDDCGFEVPWDFSNWKCVAAPCPGGNCISRDKCKRCSKALPSRLMPTSRPIFSPDAHVPFTSAARPAAPASVDAIAINTADVVSELIRPENASTANETTSRTIVEAPTTGAPVIVLGDSTTTERTAVNASLSDEVVVTVVANDAITTTTVVSIDNNATTISPTANNEAEVILTTVSSTDSAVSGNATTEAIPVARGTNAPIVSVTTN